MGIIKELKSVAGTKETQQLMGQRSNRVNPGGVVLTIGMMGCDGRGGGGGGGEPEQRQWSWVIEKKTDRHPGDLPGSPVVKILQFQFMGRGFSPSSGF